MAIRLDILDNPDNEILLNRVFENPYKEILEKLGDYEARTTVISQDFLKQHTITGALGVKRLHTT